MHWPAGETGRGPVAWGLGLVAWGLHLGSGACTWSLGPVSGLGTVPGIWGLCLEPGPWGLGPAPCTWAGLGGERTTGALQGWSTEEVEGMSGET